MNKTLIKLQEELWNSNRLKEKVPTKLAESAPSDMTLNLFELAFNPVERQVAVSYYVVDHEYPPATISFEELEKLIIQAG